MGARGLGIAAGQRCCSLLSTARHANSFSSQPTHPSSGPPRDAVPHKHQPLALEALLRLRLAEALQWAAADGQPVGGAVAQTPLHVFRPQQRVEQAGPRRRPLLHTGRAGGQLGRREGGSCWWCCCTGFSRALNQQCARLQLCIESAQNKHWQASAAVAAVRIVCLLEGGAHLVGSRSRSKRPGTARPCVEQQHCDAQRSSCCCRRCHHPPLGPGQRHAAAGGSGRELLAATLPPPPQQPPRAWLGGPLPACQTALAGMPQPASGGLWSHQESG